MFGFDLNLSFINFLVYYVASFIFLFGKKGVQSLAQGPYEEYIGPYIERLKSYSMKANTVCFNMLVVHTR